MSDFGTDEPVPQWLNERFDARTSLPKGPLEHLPIPLEGEITGALSIAPSGNIAHEWKVTAKCREGLDHTLAFYEEYLPLSGYEVPAVGTFMVRGGDNASSAHLLILHRGCHAGSLVLRNTPVELMTYIEAEMGGVDTAPYDQCSSRASLSRLTHVRWQRLPE